MAGDGNVLDLDHVGRELVGDVPRDLDRAVHRHGRDLDARGVRVGMAIHVGLAQRLQREGNQVSNSCTCDAFPTLAAYTWKMMFSSVEKAVSVPMALTSLNTSS
jgi:hypothetical protein